MPIPNELRNEPSGTEQAVASINLVQIASAAITRNKDMMVHSLTQPQTEKDQIIVDFASKHEEQLTTFYHSVFMSDLFALVGRAAEYARDDQASAEFLRSYLQEIEEIISLLRPTLNKAANPRLFEAR